jgi:hypothetical protein
MSTTRLWNDMLDVQCGSLQRLMHAALCTTARGSVLDTERDVSPGHHCGVRPSNWSAVARTSARKKEWEGKKCRGTSPNGMCQRGQPYCGRYPPPSRSQDGWRRRHPRGG